MHKTFYIPEEKEDLVEKVQQVSDTDSFSSTVLEALEEYVERRDTRSELERKLDELEKKKRRLEVSHDHIQEQIEDVKQKLKDKKAPTERSLFEEDEPDKDSRLSVEMEDD